MPNKEVIEILDRYAKKEVNEDNVANFYTEIKKVVKC